MPTSWGPSAWGQRFTGSGHWQLVLDDDGLTVKLGGGSLRGGIEALTASDVRIGPFWSAINVPLGDGPLVLRGIRTRDARRLARAIKTSLDLHREAARSADLREKFDHEALGARAWAEAFSSAARAHLATKGWLTREFRLHWESLKPSGDFTALLDEPSLAGHIATRDRDVLEAVELFKADLRNEVAGRNENHLRTETAACRAFFNRVEQSPLTDEQIRAVVCFDNRVQVIASAGSGKTSTMVAKAAYALHRNLVPAEKILLLAFNADAAGELQQRIRDRLLPLGLDGGNVAARTFHAFGLEIIGRATGRKPTLAPWLEAGEDLAQLSGIIQDLRNTTRIFVPDGICSAWSSDGTFPTSARKKATLKTGTRAPRPPDSARSRVTWSRARASG